NQSDFLEFTQRWIGNQGQIIGTALPASIDYREADYRGALMILMGNEQAGLPPTLMQACTQLIRLPMLGRSDSLNLAVATGITLYEALRHKR
ncbi:MAG: RNA methyltransferase, partial [Candidatus Puniceispirillum sp.]|nr:RNA methyltransferase [Candidatus Puniceispirillum sp.]